MYLKVEKVDLNFVIDVAQTGDGSRVHGAMALISRPGNLCLKSKTENVVYVTMSRQT